MTSPAFHAFKIGLVAVGAAMALSVSAPTAPALAQGQCDAPGTVAMQAQSGVPGSYLLEILQGQQAQILVANYNAIEPVSEFVAEFVATLATPDKSFVFMIAYTGNCVVFSEAMPMSLYVKLKDARV